MMQSRPAVVSDVFAVELQPLQHSGDPRPYMDGLTDEDLDVMAARTVESEDGRPLAVCGATPKSPGVAEVWALFSLEALAVHKELTPEIIRWMDWTYEARGYRRMQATADDSFAAAHRYLLRLGFEPEGRMKGYGMNGETCWMYGRVR